jgi:myo-inositol-1(or 4)-monophosphatase
MEPHVTDELLITAIHAARLAGDYIIDSIGSLTESEINEKQASDFVTRVDSESEKRVINAIKQTYPHHTFLAEESLKETDEEYRWIIDPLDGTTNFIHGYPVFSVSIALQHRGEIIIGLVLDPSRDELFTAEKGAGAFLNGRPVYVSDVTDFSNSLITTGFPFRRKDLIESYLGVFRNVFDRVSDIRRAGSAALDLAYLASGRCDGFFEIGLSPWDIAAGSLLIKEAGGIVSDFGGGTNYLSTGNIVAGTTMTHEKILEEVRTIFKGTLDE